MAKEINIGNNNAFDYINKKIEKNKEKVITPAYTPTISNKVENEVNLIENTNPVETKKEESKKDGKEPTRQFSVYIPISLFNKFRVYSEIKGISQKKVLVDALKEYMDKISDEYIKEELLSQRPF